MVDRTDDREKHPKYFHEVKKWQFRCIVSLASLGLFLMLDDLYPDELVRLVSSIGGLTASGLGFFFALKWRSAAKRTKSPQLENETLKREV